MEKKKKDGLHVNRYKTLKEHRAAVAARKTLKSGKNKGPVANAAAYGETIKKKPAAKPAAKKPAPKKSSPAPAPKTSRPKQTVNGASLGSKLTPAERKKRLAEMAKTGSTTQGKSMPSNPALKSQPKTKRQGASGVRKTGSRKTTPTSKPSKPKRSRRQNRRSRGY